MKFKKLKSTGKYTSFGTPALGGEKAYKLRIQGLGWDEICKQTHYRSADSAYQGARRYAKKNKLKPVSRKWKNGSRFILAKELYDEKMFVDENGKTQTWEEGSQIFRLPTYRAKNYVRLWCQRRNIQFPQ